MNPSLKVLLGYDIDEASERKVVNQFEALGSKLESVGARLSLVLTAPLLLVGAKIKNLASDMEESLNKVNVAFGQSAKEIEDFSNTTLKSIGISKGEALDMAAKFGDMATSMGFNTEQAAQMSKGLVSLSGDLSSFKNVRLDVANTALTSVFTGETESLKGLGVVMTEANLQAFALSQGIKEKIDKMSQAEKVALRYAYVMDVTKNSQGDFARTSEGAANQQRIFGETLKQVGTNLGAIILPAFTKVLTVVNSLLERFDKLDVSTKRNILIGGGFAALLGPTLVALGGLISSLKTIGLLFGTTAASAGLFAAGLAASAYLVIENWQKVKSFFIELEIAFFKLKMGINAMLQNMFGAFNINAFSDVPEALENITRWSKGAGSGLAGVGKEIKDIYGNAMALFEGLKNQDTQTDKPFNSISKGADIATESVDRLDRKLKELENNQFFAESKANTERALSSFDGSGLEKLPNIYKSRESQSSLGEALKKYFDLTPLGEQIDKSSKLMQDKVNNLMNNMLPKNGFSPIFVKLAKRAGVDFTDGLSELEKDMMGAIAEKYASIKNGLQNLIMDVSNALGDAFESMFTMAFDRDVKFDFKKVLGGFMKAMGQMISTIGSAILAAGIGLSGSVFGLGEGVKSIAAGAGLIALGASLSAGGGVIASRTTPSESTGYRNSFYGPSNSPYGFNGGKVEFEIQGSKLVGVLNNTNLMHG